MAGRTFATAPDTVMSRIKLMLDKYHKELTPETFRGTGEHYEIKIEAILAFGPRNKDGVITGPSIRVRGCKAYACIRVTTLEERIAGRGDAIIWFDGDNYKSWPPERFDAIIDHELTHLELALDRYGDPRYDDAGRLCLRLRPHDFEVGWFDCIAERHSEWAVETEQAGVLAVSKQMYFPGFEITRTEQRKRA